MGHEAAVAVSAPTAVAVRGGTLIRTRDEYEAALQMFIRRIRWHCTWRRICGVADDVISWDTCTWSQRCLEHLVRGGAAKTEQRHRQHRCLGRGEGTCRSLPSVDWDCRTTADSSGSGDRRPVAGQKIMVKTILIGHRFGNIPIGQAFGDQSGDLVSSPGEWQRHRARSQCWTDRASALHGHHLSSGA